jgi:hypothetical protein
VVIFHRVQPIAFVIYQTLQTENKSICKKEIIVSIIHALGHLLDKGLRDPTDLFLR